MSAKYMRKDSEVEAIVWNTANYRQMRKFLGSKVSMKILDNGTLHIWNKYRDLKVPSGYYLIKSTCRNRHYSVLSMDEFEEIYEKMYAEIID